MPTENTPGLTSLGLGHLIVKTKRHHYSIMSARRKKGGRTDSLEHRRTRSTHHEDTTTCAWRNRAPSVTTFISPLLCHTGDDVDKEEVIRKHTRETSLALSIEVTVSGVTYLSEVNNC